MLVRKKEHLVQQKKPQIRENPQLVILDTDDGEGMRHGEVYTRLPALGVSNRLARQRLPAHCEEQVAAQLDYAETCMNVKSMVSFLIAARERNFGAEDAAEEPSSAKLLAERLRRIPDVIKSARRRRAMQTSSCL